MHHPGGPVLPQKGQDVGVGLPVVDHHGQGELLRQLQLEPEHLLLPVLGAGVQPVVVETDLPHSHHFGPAKPGPHLLQPIMGQVPGLLGVDARRAVHIAVPLGELPGGLAAS